MIRFEVTDTGIGISPAQQRRLFESFTQADASTTRRYGGTGLGLTISKQLAELMGGEIGVDSKEGEGSTFWFQIPLEKRPEEAQSTPTHIRILRGLRLLIVDDNATNRRILCEQTASWGMDSGSAESGREALKKLRLAVEEGRPYDLVILDMQMPGMDGLEEARRIKADPAIRSTRMTLLTSMGDWGDARTARTAGIGAYLTKPVRESELYNSLITLINGPVRSGQQEAQLVTRHSVREEQAGSRPHVLVAEDNAINQKVAAQMLEELGYRVDVAADGLEAVEAVSRNSYAMVLMDIQMPQMDGYEATQEVRRREAADNGRHVPIIAMTANAMEGDRKKALQAGMDDYLTKPVEFEGLEEIVKRWVSPDGEPEETTPDATLEEGRGEGRGEPLDLARLEDLRKLRKGKAGLLDELIEMFFEEVPSRLAALRGAVEAEEAHSVERIAHTLKGISANLGAQGMSEICAQLQDLGGSQDLARAPELLEDLEEEFGRVRPALEDQLRRS